MIRDLEDLFGAVCIAIVIVLLSLAVWTIVTDEYTVKEKHILVNPIYKTIYTCNESYGTNDGREIAACETKEECNDICENARNN